ncbi:hypothetical protein [Paenibacillus alba]|uniref:Uncharacterized protein n=1 Tax=Paenibacillus alba TaxID=1197127 RepID=A0ABU6G8L4_9BACL|nr:hypothetical protein [Paenibacillus alba]MEC0229964.1 hypothetical protein [Paenibacillus alba]
MKLSKIKIVFLSFVLFISIAYAVNYIKLFIDARYIDTSPEASIEQYLRSNTNGYQIKSIDLIKINITGNISLDLFQ